MSRFPWIFYNNVVRQLFLVLMLFAGSALTPASALDEYLLNPGDIIKVTVFKSPDLSTEARVSEAGSIGFPLIGSVPVVGLTLAGAERKIAQMLKDGGFVLNPQVNVLLTLSVGNQVAVLGEVNKPGRYPIEGAGGHVSGMLASAGGISAAGADVMVLTGTRGGKPFRREVDVVKMSQSASAADDPELAGGDTLFVNRAPQFYIYGQVQRPGGYRLEKRMTVMQALATGGGGISNSEFPPAKHNHQLRLCRRVGLDRRAGPAAAKAEAEGRVRRRRRARCRTSRAALRSVRSRDHGPPVPSP